MKEDAAVIWNEMDTRQN